MSSEDLYGEALRLFRDSQDMASTDPFFEVLKQFLRSGRNTERNQLDLNQSTADFNAASVKVWQFAQQSMTLQGICGDRNKVTHQHVYSMEEFSQTRLDGCATAGKVSVSAAKSFVDGVFDSSVAISRVEVELLSYLNDLKQKGPEAYGNQRVYQVIGVLFKLLRTCAPDDHFAESIIKWIYTFAMNSLFLPSDGVDTSRGRLLMLLHILRVHNAFICKLIPLVQPPVLSSSESFHRLQQLYFVMLKTVLSKADDRAQFLNAAAGKNLLVSGATTPNGDGTNFVFVDEFDSGAGVSLQPADVEEPSLIQLLAQFEISRVLSIVFSDSISKNEAFTFGQQLVDILFIGLSTYNSPPFRAFIKAMMFHICEVLSAAKSHHDQKAYETFFMTVFGRFSSELKFPFSVLWVGLPYENLSPKSRCRIFCRIADFTALPSSNYLRAARDFSMALFRLPLHDCAYLLNVCLAIAATPFEENDEVKKDLVANVATCVLFVSHLLPSASDVLWEITRQPFTSFIADRPYVINRLIEAMSEHLSACIANARPGAIINVVRNWLELSDFFKSLNYSKFEPDDTTWNILEYWLVHSDITSGEYLLAKDIFNNLPWTPRAPGLPSFLNQSHHHRAAIVILRWSARINLPTNDRKAAWSIMLRLHLVNRNTEPSAYSVAETAPFVKTGEPLACYAALLMSPSINASLPDFVSQGLPLIKAMLDRKYPNEAIHALLLVLADHYSQSALEYLMVSKDFCELIDRILTCSMVDMIKGWAFESSLPKDVLAYGIVGHIRSMNAYMVLEFWVCILGCCSEGFQKATVMDALEVLISLTPALPDGLSTLNSVISNHYVDFVESARKHASPVRTFFSWIVGLPFSLVQSSTQSARWPWFCIASLSRDLQTEFETSFALRFHENLITSPSSPLDKIFKVTMNAVEEDNSKNPTAKQKSELLPTSAEAMAIFRLAQFVSQQAVVNHAATPLVWLLFFRAYLRRPTWHAKGCGFILLHEQQSVVKKQMIASLTTALKTAVAATASLSAANNVARECHQLYQAMILWLEEPRLHMENFDPKNLPPAFLPEIVVTVIDPASNPWPSETLQLWLFRFVDLQEVSDNINMFADKFRTLTQSQPTQLLNTSANDRSSTAAALGNDSKPPMALYMALPNAAKYSIKPLFNEITEPMCRDFSASLQILMVSLDSFRVFSTWVSEQESAMGVAHEKILETLPNLCTYEQVEERISKPCSTFTSYLRPCSSPAILVARYRRAKRIPSQESALNQYFAQVQSAVNCLTSLLSPTSSQSPVQIAVSAIRLESLISKVVETSDAQDTGRSLYYTIATFIDNNPSMWQTTWDTFLSQCLEMLGQAFIRPCENQQKPGRGCLLETIINSVKSDYVRRLMSYDFIPYPPSTPGLMETIAAAIASRKLTPDFAFTLLSKFDTKSWISELTPQQRSALLGGTLHCIVSAQAHADYASHCLIDKLNCIVEVCLTHNYPELLHYSLEQYVFFTETYQSCVLPPSVWKVLLTSVIGGNEQNCPFLSVDGPLSLQIVDQELRYLAEIFASKARPSVENAVAWKAAVAPLSLIASRFYCLAVDRAVLVARVTTSATSSFDMYGMLMSVFGPLILPPLKTPMNDATLPELRPCFASFGDCLLHLQQASSEIRFANTMNIFSRLLATYLEEMLEAATVSPNYARELHACFGRLQWTQYVPANTGEVEILELLCSRDGVSPFWTGTVCSIDWKSLSTSNRSNFSTPEMRTLLISSLVRLTYNSIARYPRSSPIGDLVAGCLVEATRQLDLELLNFSVFNQLCAEVRSTGSRPLPPQVVYAWASDDSCSLQSFKDCLVFLETISFCFQIPEKPLTEATLARSCEFIRLVGSLLFDCLSADSKQKEQSKYQQQQSSLAIARVIGAILKRCELLLRASSSSPSISFLAGRICGTGLEPLNQSVAFANRLLPAYVEYFSSLLSDKAFIVYWLSSVCRLVTSATVAINLSEALLRIYRQVSPSFSWETVQTLVTFTSCQKSAQAPPPLPIPSPPEAIVSYSSTRSVHISGVSTTAVQPGQETGGRKQTALDEFILLGAIAATNDALLVVQALARRAISAVIGEDNFDLKKATIFTFSDMLVRCCEAPKPGDETSLLGLWALWLTQLVDMEKYLAVSGVTSGVGINSLALDLAFVARLSTLVSVLNRLGETRSTRGILGAIGLGSKSQLPPWFHLFARGSACLLARQYPDCVRKSGSSSAVGANPYKQMLDSLSLLLRSDREYANYSTLILALVSIVQDTSVPFCISVERLIGEFRAYTC